MAKNLVCEQGCFYEGYDKKEIDNLLKDKANASEIYTKTETNNLLNNKFDKENVKTTPTISDESTYSCNYINGTNKYSTEETKTGMKWIDGKDIYRKVIHIPTVTQEITLLDHNITNLSQVIRYYGYCYNSQFNTKVPIPCITSHDDLDTGGYGYLLITAFTDTKYYLSVYKPSWYSLDTHEYQCKDLYIVLEYTKTE